MNYPDRNWGINGFYQGWLTSKHKFQHHFRVIPGRCGVAGTISFESVALPGRFLYIYNNLIYFAGYKDIQRMKLHYKISTCFYPRYNKYFEVRIKIHLTRNVKHKSFFSISFELIFNCDGKKTHNMNF